MERGDDRRLPARSAIPDPAVLGLDIVFPAAMAGPGGRAHDRRREVVAAGAGASIGVGASLTLGPSVGIVLGGLVGPLLGMAMPTPAGGPADGRGRVVAPAPAQPHGGRRGGADADAGARTARRAGPEAVAVSNELVLLAVLMGAVTYPSARMPMLAPGIERLARPCAALPAARRAGGPRLDRRLADARPGTGGRATRS